MAVAFVKKSAQVSVANGTSLAPSLASVVAGNLIVMTVTASRGDNATTAISAPAGWSVAENPAAAGVPTAFNAYAPVVAIFYKANSAGGTESGTITLPAGSYGYAEISEYSGVATATPLDAHTNSTGTTGTSAGTGTTGATALADSVAIVVGHPEDGSGSTNSLSDPPSSGYTTLYTNPDNSAIIAASSGYKILSATGTQTASWTWTTSSFFTNAIAVFKGVAASGTSVTPGVGTVAITGYAPSIAQPQTAGPGVGALTLTGYAPTISQPQTASPGAGTVAITGYAPAVVQGANVAAGVGALAITGYAPSLAQTANQAVSPGVGAVVITGYAPTVAQASASTSIDAGAGVLAITGYAPDVVQTGGGGRTDAKAKVRKRVNELNRRILEAEALEEAQEITQVAVTKAKSAPKSADQGFDEDEEEALMLLL